MQVVAMLGRGVLDPGEPVLRADDLGLTRGDGCFEGCRVLWSADRGGATIDKLDAHLDRMARSAAALEIPFDRAAWTALVELALAELVRLGRPGPDEPGEASAKLMLTRGAGSDGPTGLLTISPFPREYPEQRRTGLRAITLTRGLRADAFADAPWLLGGGKTLSYAINMAAVREAARRGADDAIFVSSDGEILESSTGTVVWSQDGTLLTPPPGANGILAGTTVARLFEQARAAGWGTASRPITLDELRGVRTCWLVSSVRGPIEVIELDGIAREPNPALHAEVCRLAGF